MIPISFLRWNSLLCRRSVVWYIDNTSAMASFLKGASKNAHLERIVAITWITAYYLKIDIWFEWVDSESNWSDGISRDLGEDDVSSRLGFHTEGVSPDMQWWNDDLSNIWHHIKTVINPHQEEQESSVGE